MAKKRVAIAMAAMMLFSSVIANSTDTVLAQEIQQEAAAYAVGDRLHGFIVTDSFAHPAVNAQVTVWEHEKTGAEAYFVQNDDPNRCFSITFRTEPSDDTGKLHILEHAVCASSEKYPGRDVFFDSISQAYITGLNAFTALSATGYYVTSTSEDQLEVMSDFYLDSAFNSSLRTEDKYFRREGWRYALEDAESPITIEGIVYNEMQGVYGSIDSAAYHNIQTSLFPDTYQKYESGGLPADIPALSYEELLAFYDECYHPTNATVMFYGDVDTARFLKLMDEGYFAAFEKGKEAVYSEGQKPFAEPVRSHYKFPVSADSEQTGGTIVYTAALPEDVPFVDTLALMIGMQYLSDPASPLMTALDKSGIGSAYWIYGTYIGTQYVVIAEASDADLSRADAFRSIVFESINEVVENGAEMDLLESIIAEEELSAMLSANQTEVGVELMERMLNSIDCGNMELFSIENYYEDAYAILRKEGLEPLLKEYFLENPHAALVTTEPEPGLLEKQEAELTEALAQKKAAMSADEIAALIQETEEFAAWSAQETPTETIEKLKVETPSSIDISVNTYPVQTDMLDGVLISSAQVDAELSYCEYVFDLSHLDIQELREMYLYGCLEGNATYNRKRKEISLESRELLMNYDVSVDVKEQSDGSAYPALVIGFYAKDTDMAKAAQLAMEMAAEIDLAVAADSIEQSIGQLNQRYYNGDELYTTFSLNAAMGNSSTSGMLCNTLFGMGYADFAKELDADWQADPQAVTDRLEAVRQKAFQSENAKIMLVGSEDSRENTIKALTAQMPASVGRKEKGNWTEIAEVPEKAAVIADTSASYAVMAADLEGIGEKPSGAMMVAMQMLQNEILLPEFRFELGAYGTGIDVGITGNFAVSLYRAPHFADALVRVQELPAELRRMADTVTQEELDGYKLAVLSELLMPVGQWDAAYRQMAYRQKGVTTADRKEILTQVVNTQPADLKKAADVLEKALENAGVFVISSADQIEANQDLFDKVY